jgi:hypothetical protein
MRHFTAEMVILRLMAIVIEYCPQLALPSLAACVYRAMIGGLVFLAAATAEAAQPNVIDAPAGQQVDVYTGVLTTGTVWVRIVAQVGAPCANFWWIEWPFGRVEQLGRRCGVVRFDIPSKFKGSAASRLRAGAISSNLKLAVSSEETAVITIHLGF